MGLSARLAVATPIAVLASFAFVATLRLSVAETLARRDNVDALERAARIMPSNAEYRARLAILVSTRQDDLRAAIQSNPREPSWWILLAVQQEEEGNVSGAEKSLLEANRVCRYFVPRWSMAAFQYRHGRPTEFVRWARAAIATEAKTPESLFQMARKLGIAPDRILDGMLPETPPALEAYLRFLVDQGSLPEVYAAAVKLISVGGKEDRQGLFQAIEALYGAGRTNEAVDLWNRVVQARWIGFSALDPSLGVSLSNGNFQSERLERGFDWRYPAALGVSFSQPESTGGLAIQFSGNQPESCALLTQHLPLLPGRQYQIVTRYRAQGIAPNGGLRWTIATNADDHLAIYSPIPGENETSGEVRTTFGAPPHPGPLDLLLEYRRQPGTTRIAGTVWIYSVQILLLP